MNKLFALFLVAAIAGCGQMVEFPDAPTNGSEPDSGNDNSDLPCDCLDSGGDSSSSLLPDLVGVVHTFDGSVEEVDSGVVENDSGLEQDSDVLDGGVVDTTDSSVEDSGVQVDDASVSEDSGMTVDSGSDTDASNVCSGEGLTCEQKLHCCMDACKATVHNTKCKEHTACVQACAHEHKVCVFKRLPHDEQVRVCNSRH